MDGHRNPLGRGSRLAVVAAGLLAALALLSHYCWSPDRDIATPISAEAIEDGSGAEVLSSSMEPEALRGLIHEEFSIHVTDTETGEGVDHARVVYCLWKISTPSVIDSTYSEKAFTDDNGMALLPAKGFSSGLAMIEAEGYATKVANLKLQSGGTREVALIGAGAIRIKCNGYNGTSGPLLASLIPVEEIIPDGVEAGQRLLFGREPRSIAKALLAGDLKASELKGLPTHDDDLLIVNGVCTKQAAEGMFLWHGLPESREYRWRLDTPIDVEMQPPPEQGPIQIDVNGRITHGVSPSRRISGPINISRGEITEISIDFSGSCIVMGAAPLHLWDQTGGASCIKLRNRKLHGAGAGGKGIMANLVSAITALDASGRFLFTGVSPGTKRLNARWTDEVGRVCFSALEFTLEPGEIRDLGSLDLVPGECGLDVVYVDEAGRHLLPADVLTDPPSSIHIAIIAGSVEPPTARIVDRFDISLTGQTSMLGLPLGDYRIELSDTRNQWKSTKRPLALVPAPNRCVDFTHDGASEVRIEISVAHHGEIRILAKTETQDLTFCGSALLFQEGNPPVVFSMGGSGEPGLAIGGASLPMGEYGLTVSLSSSDSDRSWSYVGRVSVPEVSEDYIPILVSPAATAHGRLLGKDGNPVVHYPFQVGIGEAVVLNPRAAHLTVVTDGQGYFSVHGIPVGAEIDSPVVDFGLNQATRGDSLELGDVYMR